jgi:hypothetical protein
MPTTQLAPGGQIALPPNLVNCLRLRDGRPASLLHAEIRDGGVLLSPTETLRKWIAEAEADMEVLKRDPA